MPDNKLSLSLSQARVWLRDFVASYSELFLLALLGLTVLVGKTVFDLKLAPTPAGIHQRAPVLSYFCRNLRGNGRSFGLSRDIVMNPFELRSALLAAFTCCLMG